MIVFHHLEITHSRLFGITTDYASSTYLLIVKVQSTLHAAAIKWPVSRIHVICIAHIIYLELGAFRSGYGIMLQVSKSKRRKDKRRKYTTVIE
jgi:hypothetical protein